MRLLLCLPLLAHAQTAGIVLDATNNTPLPGVKLTLGYSTLTATTDAAGRFQFPKPESAERSIKAEKLGYATLQSPVTTATIRLFPESTLSGRILSADGLPIMGWVTLTQSEFPAYVATAEAKNGAFQILALPAGAYKLSAQATTYYGPRTFYPNAVSHRDGQIIQLAPAEHKTGIEITLHKVAQVTVRGRFLGELPPGERIFVSPERVNGESQGVAQTGQFDAAGNFTLKTIPGEFRLKVTNFPTDRERRPVILGYLDATIPSTGLENIEIPASPIRTIRAKFRWLNSPAPVPGQPGIMLNPMDRLGVAAWTKPGPDGTATAQNVSPDRYSILPLNLPSNSYVHSIHAGGADISQRGLDLITGTATELELLLATDGATLSGRAPSAADVHIVPVSPHRPEQERNIRNATPDANGNFTVTAVAPGEYTVTAKPHPPQTIQLKPNAQVKITF